MKGDETMARSCGSCRFFVPTKTLEGWNSGAEPEVGECRRNPPVPNVGVDFIGEFPVVSADEGWCGEFRPGDSE